MTTFIYTSTTYLDCACAGTAIIKLPDEYLLAGGNFLEVTIDTYRTSLDPCGVKRFNYYIEYDETYLVEAHQVLYSSDVVCAFCKDCLVEYIEDLLGSPK